MKNNNFSLIKFKDHIDERGSLIAIETLPFEIKRIYYLFKPNIQKKRGMHAHKNLKQILISISGKCLLHLDDGDYKVDIVLDNPNTGILINKPVWREIRQLTNDSVVLCLASDIYKEEDYLRDYNEFLRFIKK